MKALLCTHYGTPDDLTLADIPDPVPGEGEAVVRIEAAALNFFDTLIIANKYQTKPPLPFSPAAEFAGTVGAKHQASQLCQNALHVQAMARVACRDRRYQIDQIRIASMRVAPPASALHGTTLRAEGSRRS